MPRFLTMIYSYLIISIDSTIAINSFLAKGAQEEYMGNKIIGIDLGTTNSVVAIMEGGQPEVITNEEGNRITPSAVAFSEDGEVLVGQIAKRQMVTNPENTITSTKRFMGRRYDEVATEKKTITYKLVKGKSDRVEIEARGKKYTPEQISAHILRKLKKAAEDYLGEEVHRAVITVPAYFNDDQRQATKDAGKIAGFEVERIVNEPTAASLAYGLDKKEDEVIAVYDFGGGTFDISILEVGEGICEVKATNGDTHLGGDDIDQRIIDWIIAEFKKDQGIDLAGDKMALQRLKEVAEKAKMELSSKMETDISLPYITADAGGPKHLTLKLNRAKLDQLADDLFQRTVKPCQQAMKDAGVSPDEIDQVVLVGGSTRIPRVQEIVEELFKKEPHRGVNPDEVVAFGAAVQAGVLSGEVEDMVLLDVTPLSLGIETLGAVMTRLIKKNTTIPTEASEIFTTAEDTQTSVEVHVLQGERDLARDNRTLGRFHLTGIPPAPRGIPQIEVKFKIDANGIINVTAKDNGTGKEQDITITASSQLSQEEIERMKKEAEEHAEEDQQKRGEIEARNRADNLVYMTEKTLDEHREKISTDQAKAIEAALEETKKAMKEGDPDAIEKAAKELEAASHKLTQHVYEKQAEAKTQDEAKQEASGGDGSKGDESAVEGEVIDAEYEDVDEEAS